VENGYYIDRNLCDKGFADVLTREIRRIELDTAYASFPLEYMSQYISQKATDILQHPNYESFDVEVPVLNEPCRFHMELSFTEPQESLLRYILDVQKTIKRIFPRVADYSCYLLCSDPTNCFTIRLVFSHVYERYDTVQNLAMCIQMGLCRKFVECERPAGLSPKFISTYSQTYIPCQTCGGPSCHTRLYCRHCKKVGYIQSESLKPFAKLDTEGSYSLLDQKMMSEWLLKVLSETTLHPLSHVSYEPIAYLEKLITGDCKRVKRRRPEYIPKTIFHPYHHDILKIHPVAQMSLSFMISDAIRVKSPNRILLYVTGYGSNHCRYFNNGMVPHPGNVPSIFFVLKPGGHLTQSCVHQACQTRQPKFHDRMYICSSQ
jgi:uncharacterized protein YodC (DUF2158 family)